MFIEYLKAKFLPKEDMDIEFIVINYDINHKYLAL